MPWFHRRWDDISNQGTVLKLAEKYDVAIVGAGIAAAGMGAQLAQRGLKIVLLESEDRPGMHSTGRSAAIFVQNYGNDTIRALSRASFQYFQNPPKEIFDYSVLGDRGILFVANEANKPHLDDLLAAGEGLVPISVEKALEMVPLLDKDQLAAAAHEPNAKDLDVAALHQGWLKQVKKFGGEVRTDSEVLSGSNQSGYWVLETKSGTVEADKIVDAAGAWGDVVAERCGVRPVGLQPKRRSIGVLASPMPEQSMHWPMLIDAGETWYMKPDAGQFLVSPADEDPVEPHDAFVDDMVLAEGLFRFEEMMDFEVTRLEHSWAGLRVFPPDGTPISGYSADQKGFFWLAGQGGYGIQTSAALSELAACQLMEIDLPEFAEQWLVDSLSPARFE